MSIYEFKVKAASGKEISLADYKGNVLLIVNTASKCGFTPQYEDLQRLYEKYHARGLEILAFPCNQFANQEPGDEKSISNECLVNYGVTFPMFSKIEVNGENTHPLFIYLKKNLKGFFGNNIKWNFTKFLIDNEGNPIKRFAPFTKPEKIEKYIENLIK